MFSQQLNATFFTCDQLWSVGNKYPVFQNLSSLSRAHILYNAHTHTVGIGSLLYLY